jgi:hypothetical protein
MKNFARGGVAKQGILSQPKISQGSSSPSSSTMGFGALSHEDHLAQMRRTQELSMAQALERDALLVHNREKRAGGWGRATKKARCVMAFQNMPFQMF